MQRLTWDEAMDRFGSDKPDLRFGMELVNMSEAVKDSDFKVFNAIVEDGGVVKAINVKGYAAIPRRELDGLVEFVGIYGAKGLAWMQIQEDGSVKSPIAKFFSEAHLANILKTAAAEPGDLILFVADKPAVVAQALGALRLEMAKRRELIDEDMLAFAWVVDFPMFEYNDEEKRYVTKILLCWLPILVKYMPKLTIWYLMVQKSAAVPSVSIVVMSKTKFSRLSVLPKSRQKRNSAL